MYSCSELFLKPVVQVTIHPYTMTTARKTRAQCNAEAVARRKSHRIPRVTEGQFTFDKAVAEVEHRGFVVAADAEDYWNEQTCKPSRRKMRVIHHDYIKDIRLDDILEGHTMSSKPTAEARKASNARNSATHKARKLGPRYWMEAAGIKAAMKALDPEGLLEVRLLPDGLNADYLVRPVNSTEDAWVAVQMKTAEAYDGQVKLSVKKEDGKGKYKDMIISGAVLKVDEKAAKKIMQVFGAIPEVEVTELFLYGSASDMHCASLQPYPRRERDDAYGDNRFVSSFDNPERLEIMQDNLLHLAHTMPKTTYKDACCSFGPGTLNVKLNEKHKDEVLNMKALAEVTGIESLEAHALQNMTTDIMWKLEDVVVNISLKTARLNHEGRYGGYDFSLGVAPYAEHCHVVMAFYKEGTVRTHISVICARRVYVTDKKTFCWSPTNNTHVLNDRIDLRQPDALEKLTNVVMLTMM